MRDAEVEDQAPAASLVSQVVSNFHVAAPLARLLLWQRGKHGNLHTNVVEKKVSRGGEEGLSERWAKGVVGARGADGPEPGERLCLLAA
jgi:hypothetical protein